MNRGIAAVYVFWLRQLKKYVRSRPRLLASFGQPLLFLLAFGFGFGSIFAKAGQGNYILFLSPGIIAMTVLFTSMFNGIELIWDRQFGFLKETLVAPVSRSSIMIGRTFGGATVALIQGIVVFLITLPLGFRPTDAWGLLPALMFLFMMGILFTGLGNVIATFMTDMQAFPLIMNFVMMPLFFLSGALFPISGVPKAIMAITKINPVTYCIDGVRGSLLGISNFPLLFDFAVSSAFILAIFIFGTYRFRKMEA